MEANYSNYDRSQIKLKFKVLIGLKDFFFFFLLLAFQERRRRKGQKVVKQLDLLVRTGEREELPIPQRGWGQGEEKRKAEIRE